MELTEDEKATIRREANLGALPGPDHDFWTTCDNLLFAAVESVLSVRAAAEARERNELLARVVEVRDDLDVIRRDWQRDKGSRSLKFLADGVLFDTLADLNAAIRRHSAKEGR